MNFSVTLSVRPSSHILRLFQYHNLQIGLGRQPLDSSRPRHALSVLQINSVVSDVKVWPRPSSTWLHKRYFTAITRPRWVSENNKKQTRNRIISSPATIFNIVARDTVEKYQYSTSKMLPTLPENLFFRQLFDYQSYTFTYLLADLNTREAILIDPVFELVRRDVNLLEDHKLSLKYAVNTHCHADHITSSGELKKQLPNCKSIISKASGAKADIFISDGDTIEFGNLVIHVSATPGHTNGCVTYVMHHNGRPVMAFTGDAVLIRGCGRTDFQEGNSARLYKSVYDKIFSLPEDTILYPAHDYTGQSMTTVAEEKKYNPRLTKPLDEFLKIMSNLNLPYPRAIDRALPANLVCGIMEDIPTINKS